MKKNSRKILAISVFMIGCLFGGFLSKKLMVKLDLISAGRNTGDKIVLLVALLISLFASCLLAIIIHEGGHLVCGLLSGYSISYSE